MLKAMNSAPDAYLASSEAIDCDHVLVKKKAKELAAAASGEVELVKKVYDYVRDTFPHSWDIKAAEVSRSASDVLKNGHGICYAKSHLLAALLRCSGIPAGFCYQTLRLKDECSNLVLHAVSVVYIKSLKQWIRLDARGNKPGVDARFSLGEEKLAYPVRPELGEVDGWDIYAQPSPATLAVLASSKTVEELIQNLPGHI